MIYEYVCDSCGHKKDVSHSMSDSPEVKCDICPSLMRKFVSGGLGTSFIGHGWSQDLKFKRFMTKKNEDAGKRMKEHNMPVSSVNDLRKLDT